MVDSPEYQVCMLHGHHGHICEGRITFEHSIIVAGKSCQKRSFIIALCARGHSVDQFQDNHELRKDLNEWVGYCRATDAEILELCGDLPIADPKLSKARLHFKKKDLLIKKYGVWEQKYPVGAPSKEEQKQPVMMPMGQVKPPETQKPKPEDMFWKPVKGDFKKMVEYCIAFHKEVEDLHLGRQEMVDEMIKTYFERIKELQEFGTVSTAMLISQRKFEESTK